MSNIILLGFKGCGKSYFGRLFSDYMGCPWIDTDYLIEEKEGMTCQEIYQKKGALEFRQKEYEALLSLQKIEKSLISLGGGTAIHPMNQKILKSMGKLIYLKLNKEKLRNRIFSQKIPFFFDEASFEEIYRERLPIYESITSYHIDLCHKSDEEVLQIIKDYMYGE